MGGYEIYKRGEEVKQEIVKTAVIRHNEGMIRDLLIKQDSTDSAKQVLIIRQTKFREDGTLHSKFMVLTEQEMLQIFNFWSGRDE